MADLRQNLLYAGRPDERLGSIVVGFDEFLDGRDQLRNTREAAAANALVGQLAEPAFDQVEPRSRGRREVQLKASMLGQPALHLRMVVRAVVVQDQVDVQLRRNALIDLAQELAELDIAVTRIAGADHRPFERVQGGKQGRGAVALVVVCHSPATPLLERQAGLRAVERLDLRLLVDTEDDGFVWRIEIDSHHIGELLDKALVARELERFHAMGLQAVCVPNALHRGMTDCLRLGHGPRAPMCRAPRPRLCRRLHNALHLGARDRRRAPPTRGVLQQSGHPTRCKAGAPQQHGRTTGAYLLCDAPVGHAVRGQQHDACPHDDALWRSPGTDPALQGASGLPTHFKCLWGLPHRSLLPTIPELDTRVGIIPEWAVPVNLFVRHYTSPRASISCWVQPFLRNSAQNDESMSPVNSPIL